MDSNHDNLKIETLSNKKNSLQNKFWYFKLFVVSLLLCFVFAIISQLMLIKANIAVALFLVLVLIFVSVVFDVIGVAVAASNIKPFLELKKQNVRGVDKAIKLVKNADRVSSICTDVVGDICSILSGASGVAISIILISELPSVSSAVLSTFISSIIAALTVFGKALGKNYALNSSTKIMIFVGKFLEIFKKTKKNRKTNSKKSP